MFVSRKLCCFVFVFFISDSVVIICLIIFCVWFIVLVVLVCFFSEDSEKVLMVMMVSIVMLKFVSRFSGSRLVKLCWCFGRFCVFWFVLLGSLCVCFVCCIDVFV